ncbi:CARDB domain-containing protein, partial [Chromatium okenii]|uniref:InlB B-repeat-containing protein n=1 Tax=Chromatium okenii TaxID=61644 RepID=UPI0026F01313
VTASTFDLLINKVGNGTIASNPTGMTCNSTTCTGTFDTGTLVKLTAKPATGYTFSGWSDGSCLGTGICSMTMSAAQTIKATFTAAPVTLYSLSINKSGNGIVTSNPVGIKCGTGSACAAKFASNKVVTLIAKPDTDATFVSWSGCVALTTNPLICRVTMSNNKTVTAKFSTKNTAAADVYVTGVVITPASPAANSNFTAAITVKNAGNIKSDGGYLDVWADQPTPQACKAASDTWEEVGQLAAGESKTITVNLKVRGAGAKQLRAFVD